MLALIYERRAEFVASFKNRAWHIEKVKREYGITENFRFSPLSSRRRLPRGGEFENNSDLPMTFNWMEVPLCQEKPVIRMSQARNCLDGDFCAGRRRPAAPRSPRRRSSAAGT